MRSLDFFCNLGPYKKRKVLKIIDYTGITFFLGILCAADAWKPGTNVLMTLSEL